LIDEVLHVRRTEPSAQVLTDDTGMMVRARRLGVPVTRVPESWLLVPEKDDRDRQIAALRAEVADLRSTEATLSLSVSDVSGQPVKAIEDTLPLYPDLTVEETSAVMEAIQQRRPEVTTFGSKASSDPTASPPMGLSTLLEGLYTWRPPTSDQIERYKKAHAEWVTNARKALDQLGAGLNLRHRIRKLQIALANTGSRPADEVLVEFKIYGAGTLLVRVGDHVPKLIAEAEKLPHGVVLPPPPTPPKGEYVYERFARNAQYGLGHRDWTEALRIPDYFDIRASLAKHDRHEFYRREDDEKPMAEASFRCEEFRHQRPLQLFSLWIPVPVECATVQARLHIRASARNLRTPVDLHIPVDVRSEHRSTYEIAWAWHIEA
jgi:hypothetical protein